VRRRRIPAPTEHVPGLRPEADLVDTEVIIRQLLECLRVAGLVERVKEAKDAKDANEVHGYQVPASSMRWVAGRARP